MKDAKRLLASPFVWFLLAGGVLFYLEARLYPAGENLVVDGRVLARITALWQQQMGRPPSQRELAGLVGNWTDEEMLFREAKRLGLDAEDIIVRRRLIQKMQFIAEQSEVSEPDDATLKAWFAARREDYRQPRRFTFTQVFFREPPDAERQAALVAATAAEALPAPGATPSAPGATPPALGSVALAALGDATLLKPRWAQRSQRAIAREFGEAFAEALAGLEVSAAWQGPIKSEFGWHLLRLEAVQESVLPGYEAARQRARNDYLFAARAAARAAQLERLRRRYQVALQAEAP